MDIDEVEVKDLIPAREAAEKVVEGMPDGPMKVKAFEMAFQSLQAPDRQPAARKRRPRGKAAQTATGEQAAPKPRRKASGPHGHVRELIEEGFFRDWKHIPEIQQQLRVRGHHYEQEQLSKPLIRLTRARVLRREGRQREGKRDIWVYRKFKA